MPAFRKPNPVGRPPALTRVVRTREDGTPVTVADTIVDAVRAGAFIEQAAAAAGVTKSTLYDCQRTGARVLQRLHDGEQRSSFTRKELACAEFSDAVARAYAEATLIEVGTAAQLARGGLKQTKVTVRQEVASDGSSKQVTTTSTDTLAPDGAMIRWRLSKREADTWGRERLELTGADGGPVELSLTEKRARVLDTLEALGDRLTTPDPALALVPAPPPPEESPDA